MRKHVKNNVSWVGYMDWELKTFHGDEYSILNGSSQNAYLIEEEKTVLMDTVWLPHNDWFITNLKSEIDLNKIDYVVIQHSEQDHSGALVALMREIPDVPIYCSDTAKRFIEAQYGKRGWNFHTVKTGDELDIGNGKKLIFVEMKMLHWPDSIATYMTGDNILFSMDAFGQHFAVEEMWNDKADQNLLYKEAEKYFANILNPFASFVGPKIKEILDMNLTIDIIAPSHGVLWRDNPMQIVEAYQKWADAYQEDQITIVYDTMWDGTRSIAYAIADEIQRQSPDTRAKVFNCAKIDKNEIMTEVFKSKAIAVGSPTAMNDILTSVSGWLTFLKELKFVGKKAAAFGCYGWSGESVAILKERLADCGFEVVNEAVKSYWNPGEEDFAKIPALVSALLSSDKEEEAEEEAPKGASYVCPVCGWIYSEAEGAPDMGVPAGTKWAAVPDDFRCPICKVPKSKFEKVGGDDEDDAPAEDSVEEVTGNAPGQRIFRCTVCGWTYEEAKGAPDKGIKAGTKWEDVPDDFRCPVCKVPKSKFEEVQ